MNSRNQSFLIYFLLVVAIGAMLYMGYRNESGGGEALTITEIAHKIETGEISRIVVEDDSSLNVIYQDGSEAESRKEPDATLLEQLVILGVTPDQINDSGVKIEVKAPSALVGILGSLAYFLPVLLMGGVLWFIFRQAQGSNNAAMSFGKSRARMFSGDHLSPLRMWQVWRNQKKNWPKLSSFCENHRSLSSWEPVYRRGSCW